MTTVLQVGGQMIAADEMLSLLQRYQMLPQVLRGLIIDEAIAALTCTDEERQDAIALFDRQQQITSDQEREAWRSRHVMTVAQYEELATRPVLIEKFKRSRWENLIEPHFLQRKRDLDQVVYSLIRTKDFGLAHELYFRILEGEQSFEELAEQYSQGAEARVGGVIGPVGITQSHPVLANLLAASQPGKLWSPKQIGDWVVIVRVEKLLPAQLDEDMHYRMLNELFELWVQEQVQERLN